MKLSVVIVTYNNAADIDACLKSVFYAIQGLSHEVIVVDNASSDTTVEVVRSYASVRLFRSRANIGFARAVNAGADRASGEFLLLINPDAVVNPGAFTELLEYASQQPRRFPLGGRSFHDSGALDPRSCWGRPSVWSTVCFAVGLSTLFKGSKWLDPESLGSWARDDDREVGVVTGYLLMMPLSLWRRLGGFDRRFFMYGEDTDLSVRASALGFSPRIVPTATLRHTGGASSSQYGKLFLVLKGKCTYMRKHWRGARRVSGLILIQLGVGTRALAEWATRRPRHWGRAWTEREAWRQGYRTPAGEGDPLEGVGMPDER